MSPIQNSEDYKQGLKFLCTSILQESFLDKVLAQNIIIKEYKNKKKTSDTKTDNFDNNNNSDNTDNNDGVVVHSRSIQNPSSKLGCIVNAQIIEQLKLKQLEKKRRLAEGEMKKNETNFKKAKLLIHHDEILTDFKLSFTEGLWKNGNLISIQELARACGVKFSGVKKADLIENVNVKMLYLMNL